jgi:LuxR family transcriptional regulator, maltose regulon positive regulatory protein
MKTPSSLSKISPPHFPHVLKRTRLLELLNQNRDKKLILILGQAAQGKSTLAVSWVDSATEPVAWVNLDREEADPVNLFYLLVLSLRRALPAIDFSHMLSYPSMVLGPREEIPLYRDWVQPLYALLPKPVRLVLDNLDQVPSESPAYRFLPVLLDEAPPGLHFILLSREMPPLNLQTLRMRQEAFILSGEELAFSLEEIREFLKVRRLRLPARSVTQVCRLTEGWAGGLVLLCDGLERLSETAREEYLGGDLTEKFKGDVFKYFGEQVFAALPPPTQEFLVKSNILEVVDPAFIKTFLGMENAQEILEDLAGRNLFIQPIHDRKRGWLYRYHLLFRDFLSVKFKALLGEEQQQAAYFRAGVLSEEREETEQALKYYLEARAYPEAAAALVKVGLPLIMAGRTMDLTQWLVAIPDEIIRDNPWLLFYRYVSARFTGPPEILADLQRARAMFQEQGEVRGSLLAMAYLLEATSLRTHKVIGPIQALLEQGEALAQSESAQPYPVERALLLSHLGFTSYLRGGVPLKGAWACRQAYLLARNLGNVFLQTLALMHEYFSYALLGNLSIYETIAKQLDKLFEKFFFPELSPYYFISLGQSLLFRGEFLKAQELLKQAREAIERRGLNYLYPPILMCELWSKAYMPEAQDTEESARAIANLSLTMGNAFVQGLSLLMLGANRYQRENFRGAQEVLRQAWEILGSEEGRAEIQWSWTKVLLALVASHLQENGAAERGLEEALEHFSQISSQSFLREAHLAMALWKKRKRQVEAAAHHLEAGLKLGEKHGYHFSFMLNKQDMLQVCLLALELRLEGTWGYVSCILSTRLADLAGPELEKLLYHPDRRVAHKAGEIRLALHRARAPRLTIRTLGGFRLWRGETVMAEDDWAGRQPQLILKAVLSHGPQGLVKDVLLEDLWPEADSGVAEKNFKVNLYRLRRALEPELDKTFGSSYIHLKFNLLSLDAELCDLDVEKFMALVKEGEKKEAQGRGKEAVALYKEAVASYGGDFLPEELYSPWAAVKREELRETYLELLHRLGRLYEKQGALTRAIDCYKRLVRSDPLDEPACQRLMLLYVQKGRRSGALKVYQDCCLALKKELNTEPDGVTRAIHQKILTSP